jgi:hypothetical protein
MEHRCGNRVVLGQPVRVIGDRKAVGLGLLCEVSVSGGFIRTRLHVPELARVCVKWHDSLREGAAGAKRSGDRDYALEAFVVRCSEAGVALEWCQFAPGSIVRLVRRHLRTEPNTIVAQLETTHARAGGFLAADDRTVVCRVP